MTLAPSALAAVPRSRRAASALWLILGALALTTMALLVDPVLRLPYWFQITYNEGWNVYYAAAVAGGHSPYANASGLIPLNYPPLSFLLIGGLARWVTGDPLVTGRVLSLVGLLVTGASLGVALRRGGWSVYGAVFASLLCLGLFAARAKDYVGMDDPQLLAQLFTTGGFLMYVFGRSVGVRYLASTLLVVLGLLIKDSLFAVPLAMLLDALLTSRRRAVLILAGFLVWGGLAALAIGMLWGPAVFHELTVGRVYSLARLRQYNVPWLVLPAVLAAAAVWPLRRAPEVRATLVYVVVAAIGGTLLLGGQGVSTNLLFEVFIGASLLAGMGLDGLRGGLAWRKPPLLQRWAPVLLAGSLFLLLTPALLRGGIGGFPTYASRQELFSEEAAFLGGQPGTALCEDLLLCYSAGKAFEYDPFLASQLMQTSQVQRARVLNLVAAAHFRVIELDTPAERGSQERFPTDWRSTLSAHYDVARSFRGAVFWEPTAAPSS